MSNPSYNRTWVEIDLAQVGRNARALLARAGVNTAPVAVVKANAYGHGAVPVARACSAAGITHFAVATVEEAAELRRAGIAHDIYLLSPFLPGEASAIVWLDLIPMVSSGAQWDALADTARSAPLPARCFLKIDTGMGRSGASLPVGRILWQRARFAENLRITGIATHFASADEPDGLERTNTQAARFFEFLQWLGDFSEITDGRGNRGVYLSLANSPAALRLPPLSILPPGVRGTLARIGLLLYGIAPYRDAAVSMTEYGLLSVLSWRARVSLIRELPEGSAIGYGGTYVLRRDSRVATLAVGYADGLPRRLLNRGTVLLPDGVCPIIGRVSMDQCQIDVTDLADVNVGDIATIIGTVDVGGETISQSAFDIAEAIGTTPHEPTCNLSQRVGRVYLPVSAKERFP